MKKRYLTFGLALLITASLLQVQPVLANTDSNIYYSYTYDFWGLSREAPNPYTVERVLFGNDLGTENFKDPQGLFVRGNKIYVADSANNRIVEFDDSYNLIKIIDSFILNGVESTFNYPSDVFVAENGDIFVCDTNNFRVVHMDSGLNVIKILTKPQDALMDEKSEFLPTKIVVDNADRVYVIAKNVNKGIMEFDSRGSFTGYIGANKVSYNIADYIWKTLSTQAQKEQMIQFVPTEYSNIAIDKKGFFYTTCSTVSDSDIYNLLVQQDLMESMLSGLEKVSNVDPIRRLNSMGADILIKNGWYAPVGDIDWGTAGGVSGASKFIDVVPVANDTYFAIDRTRCRVFGYDFQGNLLFVFGGIGSKAGYFQYPTAIESVGDKIIVLDGRTGGVTVFNPTEYGALINKALLEYVKGNYEYSSDLWEEVLVYNANYDLAYVGIGRSLLRQDKYKEAMEYFEVKYSYDNWSKAFQQYRKQVVEKYIGVAFGSIIALIVVWQVVKLIRRIKRNEGGA